MRPVITRNGQQWVRVSEDAKFRIIKLKNRRVILGQEDDHYYLIFKNLIDAKNRQIHVTEMALSDEAMVAVVTLWCEFARKSVGAAGQGSGMGAE